MEDIKRLRKAITQLEANFKDWENAHNKWMENQCLPLQTAVATVTDAALGAAVGGLMATLSNIIPNSLSSAFFDVPRPNLQPSQVLVRCLLEARNVGVLMGDDGGITCALKGLCGKEDVQSSMIAGFGSGAIFSLVSGTGCPNHAGAVVSSGLFSAIVHAGVFMIMDKFYKPKTEDLLYKKTRSMLISLGLQNYEKNFRKGLLTDNTLTLITESSLQDIRIPPGPRLIILDHKRRSYP